MKVDFPFSEAAVSSHSVACKNPAIVGIDCRYITGRPSGIGELVQALVDHAPRLAPELRFLLLKHPDSPARLSELANVEEMVVPYAPNSPTTMWRLPQVVDLSGLSLFHATFNIMPAGLTMPCITTIHDVMWLTNPELCRPRFSRAAEGWFYRHGIKRSLRRAQAIATVSAATSFAIAEIDPEAATRLRVTLSGVSPEFRPVPQAGPALAKIGLTAGKRFILTVGQNAPYKNHEGALVAFAQAFGTNDQVDLVMVQRLGPGSKDLLKQARALGIASRVHFVSDLAREELIMLYSSAIALLHPSYCEGFGNPLAEAMACGCPVVTSNLSAMPEVTAGAALLIDVDDPASIACALLKISDDLIFAMELSRRGLSRAKVLSWLAFAEANVALYREVLGRR